jgi:uncharacterized protein (DUF58 family)
LLGFAAVNTGNNLLYLMISALLGFMAMSGLLGHLNLKWAEVRVRYDRDYFAGLNAPVSLEVHNPLRWWPLFLLRLQLGDQSGRCTVIRGGGWCRCPLPLTLPQRGYCALPEMQISSNFPVNFFIRARSLAHSEAILVFPRPLPCSAPLLADPALNPVDSHRLSAGNGDELRSIEPYRAGDSLKAMDWKHSARSDSLQVKRFYHQGETPLQLSIDQLSGPLEERLGQLTFLICQAGRQGQGVGLELPDRVFPVSTGAQQRRSMLKALALYDSA